MASFPPQRPQRSSPNRQQTSDDSIQQAPRNSTDFPSPSSVDSQTVLLQGPSSPDHASTFPADASDSSPQQQNTAANAEYSEPRRCWICFSDETDDQTPRTWRTPCPCALTAHESCPLDWVADIESPDSSQSTAHRQEIRCPQCKSEIYLSRPRDRVVEFAGKLETAYNRILLPVTGMGATYMILLAASHHGAYTIQTVFGDSDADAILHPISQRASDWNWIEQEAVARFPDLFRPLLREWRGIRVEAGLPFIPIALILSRSKLGDFALPFMTVAFFATNPAASHSLRPGYWPPSAALSLVLLPYFRGLYNDLMERVWGEKERAWAREVQPQLDGTEENRTDQAADHDHDHRHDQEEEDDDEVVQIEIDLNLGEGNVQNEVNNQDQQREEAGGDRQPVPGGAQAIEAGQGNGQALAQQQPGQEQQQPNQPQQQRPHHHQEFERQIDLIKWAYNAADTTIGALMFPSIAALSGELLKLVLPKSWIISRFREPSGLLQTKWGRSIVGGCLFVVLKDAVRIYCRWRMAVSYRERRIRDYDKKRREYV